MNRRKFFIGCLCCAGAAALYKSNIRLKPKSKIPWSYPLDDLLPGFIGHIEMHLTEHCNIGCKFCSHLSTVAEEEFYDMEKFEKDLARLSEVSQQNVYNLELLGGEPLLHPQINELLAVSRKYFPKTNIELLTNAVLLDYMPESFWLTLKENNIFLTPSLYPVKINWKSIIDKAEKYDIQFTDDDQQKFRTLENIKEDTITSFYKVNIDVNGKQSKNNTDCIFKNACVQYYDGKLFPCFIASNIRHFNRKFNKNVPLADSDFLDLYKVNSFDEISNFLNRQDIEFCKYCAGMSASCEPWTSVNEHSINEWLYDKNRIEECS